MRIWERSVVGRVVVAVIAVGVIATSGPALGAISGPHNLTVSCDGTTIKTGVTVGRTQTGNFSIRQNFANPSGSTVTWAVSQNGNSLPTKTLSSGVTGTWTSVLGGDYTVKARRSGSRNCNGLLPGAGNYTWNYTVTYQS